VGDLHPHPPPLNNSIEPAGCYPLVDMEILLLRPTRHL